MELACTGLRPHSVNLEHEAGQGIKHIIDHEILDFTGPDDPHHPNNWALLRRVWVSFMLAMFNLIVTISSSIFGSAQKEFADEFRGHIIGPLFFGSLSEKFGRKYPLVAGVAISSLFGLMPALGPNLTTFLIGRFLAGLFGVATIAVLGVVITDCWNAVYRGVALAFCISLVFSGPTFGPIIGGFIVNSSISWRWTMGVVVVTGLAISLLAAFTYLETYPPSVLQKKAKQLRKETGNQNIRSKLDMEETSPGHFVQTYLVRPWILFFSEPILVLLTLYQSFIYGLMYFCYQSYPIAFGEVHGTPAEEAGGGKIQLIDNGAYKNVDTCLMVHPMPHAPNDPNILIIAAGLPGGFIATDDVRVAFIGKPAHAAAAPWDGINALDAVVAACLNISLLRQQMEPNQSIHGVIVHGGDRPNVIPMSAAVEYCMRAPTAKSLKILKEKATKCFEAAKIATGCEVKFEWGISYSDLKVNRPICERYVDAMRAMGYDTVLDMSETPGVLSGGSTDMGNVSCCVPGFHAMYTIPADGPNHTPEFTRGSGSLEAYERSLACAAGMAVVACHILVDDELAGLVQRDFDKNL
ncbi:hypothetical protein BBP40_004114 [Aspergillus hancockii]|nr:hypothetical protein BBP40_004114 [Aspergillus hancockii]